MRVRRFDSSRAGSPFYFDRYLDVPAALVFYTHNDVKELKSVVTKVELAIGGNLYILDGIEEFVEFIKSYTFDMNKKLLVFMTGLDVFYHFIKKEFDKIETFNPRDLGVATCLIDDFIELREITTIAGQDWTKLVNGPTPIQYAYNFAKYYYSEIMMYATKEDSEVEPIVYLPVTMQQIIQTEIKQNSSKEYKELVQALMPRTSRFYKKIMTNLYMGGFCDKNPMYYNEDNEPILDLRNTVIGHIDFKTSYIARMLTDYFPITRFERSKNPEQDLESALKNKCCIIEVTYTNFKAVDTVRFLSKKRAVSISEDATVNGVDKILTASEVSFMVTELDFELINMFYSFDSFKVTDLYTSERGELPYEIRDVAHRHYYNKENLEKGSSNQLWEKWLTEIIYGATCKKLYNIDEKNWTEEVVKHAILSPYWGIWTTSHARFALLSVIKLLGNDFLYSDTDSIFFKNPYMHTQLINKYNNNVIAKNKLYCYEHSRESLLLRNDAFIKLGTFTYEDGASEEHFTINDFISSGPKAYIYALEDGTIITKVAGYKKQYMINGKLETAWIRDFPNKDELFDAFSNPNTKLDDKMTVTFVSDEPCELEYNGKVYKVKSYKLVAEKKVVLTRHKVFKKLAEQDAEYEELCIKNGREVR